MATGYREAQGKKLAQRAFSCAGQLERAPARATPLERLRGVLYPGEAAAQAEAPAAGAAIPGPTKANVVRGTGTVRAEALAGAAEIPGPTGGKRAGTA